MKITRKFTQANRSPFDTVDWVKRSSKISNTDGSAVFQMDDAEVPSSWTQLATDIMVSKYFRKAGVPQWTDSAGKSVAPLMLGGQAIDPSGKPLDASAIKPELKDGKPVLGPEKSAKQVIHRLAGCWRHWGEANGYFDTKEDAQAFYDELCFMMVHQMCAPNSPQWFNTGLHWAYGINGPAQGHWIVNPKTGVPELAEDSYSHPQPHACFIQSVDDDLVNEGGIMDLWVREARLFKYGSGTGTNFSNLRGEGEKLAGGGKSSGLMSWLRIGDRAASAIKSGGTTRRAAKMVCLDMDHPDIQEFVNWKVREEIKVAALVEGLKVLKKSNEDIKKTAEALNLNLDYDFNGEAYFTVSGQNSNNSVRVPDTFFEALDNDADWVTTWRTSGKAAKTFKARKLWDEINFAAWRCADPGVQFDTTINAWHTCPSAGRINASNPCSEYMFLDNTACNLASFNVIKFYDSVTRKFDVERYEHGIDLWTIVLEISVLMAAFPSKPIAELSYRYRTLGLGYANLGAMLMQAGIAYDSDEARAVCATLTAILTGRSYRLSALMAKEHGAFPGYEADKENMLRVIRNHRRAARGVSRTSGEWEGLNTKTRPVPTDHKLIKSGKVNIANAVELLERSTEAWDEALAFGLESGYRNAQVTVIAPTGTIGLLMDCDTTGVEPDFALVKFKKLAGGGYFKIANESVEPALKALGYDDAERKDILRYLLGKLDMDVPVPGSAPRMGADRGASVATEGRLFSQWLAEKGFTKEDIAKVAKALPGVFELKFAFGAWSLGDDLLKRLGIDAAKAKADMKFNVLAVLGLSKGQIEALNTAICGTQTIEGAPHLKQEHYPIFDCANTCGKIGKRFIEPAGHIRMMAACQPFISGAISKTINLPNSASVEDIAKCYRLSWELGLKANALYRDGCKLSQPLNSAADEDVEEEEAIVGESVKAATPTPPSKVVASAPATAAASETVEFKPAAAVVEPQIVYKAMRRRLPDTRRSITHKFNIAGHEGYLTVGLYEDGQPGELFITMAKEGSTVGGLMDSLGTATSVSLQYGVPVQSLVNKFTHQRFEPAGITSNRDIPFAKSLVDYIFRWMGMQFIPGYREANSPNRGGGGNGKPADGANRLANAHETDVWSRHVSRMTIGTEDEKVEHGVGDGRVSPASGDIIARSTGPVSTAAKMSVETKTVTTSTTLSLAMESMGDAPPCDVCGTITVRSGTCYKCLNCGASMGCS